MNARTEDRLEQENGQSEILPRILHGVLAGLVATAPMTAAMLLMHSLLPREEQEPLPPRKIAEKVVDEAEEAADKSGVENHVGEPERTALTWASHFGYGAGMGALYAPLAEKIPLSPPLGGIAFGLAVWAGSYLGLLPAMNVLHPEEESPRRHALMIAAHVVWGSVTGVLVDRLEHREERDSSDPWIKR